MKEVIVECAKCMMTGLCDEDEEIGVKSKRNKEKQIEF